MPTISRQTDLAVNTQGNNVLEGSSFEFLEYDAIVRLNMVVKNPEYYGVQCLFQIGGISLVQPPFGLVYPVATLNMNSSTPNDIYHPYITRAAAAGSRLFLAFSNKATAATVNWIVRIDTA